MPWGVAISQWWIHRRRLRLHNEVAKALEQHYAGRLGEHAAELFDHFSHSSSEEDLRKAVHYGELAAQRAAAVAAHGEAARLLEQTLQVQEVVDPEDDESRCDLLMELGHSLLSAEEPARAAAEVAPQAWALAAAYALTRGPPTYSRYISATPPKLISLRW